MAIVLEDLVKSYGKQKAVSGVSFAIEKNEIVGFLGPNGAGKSTIMRMITGIIAPDSGCIRIDNKDILLSNTHYKHKIGFLPENNPLYPDMYIREYLLHIASLYNVSSPQKRVEEVIALCQLEKESHKQIGQLSKGYRQRVGLGQALIHDPEILILDEPMTGLDPNQLLEIRELIRSVGKNKIVLFSSHIMQEVEAVCDRVLILNKGELIADTSQQNLFDTRETCMEVKFEQVIFVDKLRTLPSVNRIVETKQNSFLISSTVPFDELGKNIFQFATKNNLTLLMLSPKDQTLEHYFTSLTKE